MFGWVQQHLDWEITAKTDQQQLNIKGNQLTNQDQRCCGVGACIINEHGECWCGQVWDGEKMARPGLNSKPDQSKMQNLATDKAKSQE